MSGIQLMTSRIYNHIFFLATVKTKLSLPLGQSFSKFSLEFPETHLASPPSHINILTHKYFSVLISYTVHVDRYNPHQSKPFESEA